MKLKNIKKVIAMFSMIAVSFASLGVSTVVAEGGVITSVTPNYDGGGSNPDSSIFVKGKWEMKGHCFDVSGVAPNLVYTYNGCGDVEPQGGRTEGLDDDDATGAQFDAPGIWGENMDYTVCGIVRGPNDYIDNIRDVYAEIYYPTDRPMHTSGITCDDYNCITGCYNDDPYEIDNPSGGCGAHIEQNNLHRLNQVDGIDLVCNHLYAYNNNLPIWDPAYVAAGGPGADWGELCGAEGELTKGWAAVYCSDKSLTWEDPAGDYRVTVTAYDMEDNQSNVLENHFTYQELLGFEIDFNSVDYGIVSISEHQMIAGNKIFKENDGSSLPTVRNTGNIRLNIGIAQDDMGLGKTDYDSTVWRPEYDARVGDLYDDLVSYDPFGAKGETPIYPCDYTTLDEILDLSEIEEMDFSIHVREKWPLNLSEYTGTMWLSADRADFGGC